MRYINTRELTNKKTGDKKMGIKNRMQEFAVLNEFGEACFIIDKADDSIRKIDVASDISMDGTPLNISQYSLSRNKKKIKQASLNISTHLKMETYQNQEFYVIREN